MSNVKISSYGDCKYAKIGSLVWIWGTVSFAASSTSGGINRIGGLPYTSKYSSPIPVAYANLILANSGWTKFDMQMEGGTKYLRPVYWASGRSWNGDNAFSTTSGWVNFAGVYYTDE